VLAFTIRIKHLSYIGSPRSVDVAEAMQSSALPAQTHFFGFETSFILSMYWLLCCGGYYKKKSQK
jgi:hypothetical protein